MMRTNVGKHFLLVCLLAVSAGCGGDEPPPATEQNPFGQTPRTPAGNPIPIAANPHAAKTSAAPVVAKPVAPVAEAPSPSKAVVKTKRKKKAAEVSADETPQSTLAQIERLGGKVKVDQRDPLHPVVAIDFSGTNVNDAGLRKVTGLVTLKTLNLNHTRITGAGLASLSRLTNLKFLYLDGTKIKNADLQHLQHLTSLQELYVQGTKVNLQGVNALKKMLPKLKVSH